MDTGRTTQTIGLKTCEKHRHLTRRLRADLEGWLLKYPAAIEVVDQDTACVVCEATR